MQLQTYIHSNTPPNTNNRRQIGHEAVWTLSSAKIGNGVQQIRDDNTNTFWQSDGGQPHLINIQFMKKTRIQELAIYLDFKSDESYTPNKISIRAGNNLQDLKEVQFLDLKEPCGWYIVPFKTKFLNGEQKSYIFTMNVQICILQNQHSDQNIQLKVKGQLRRRISKFFQNRTYTVLLYQMINQVLKSINEVICLVSQFFIILNLKILLVNIFMTPRGIIVLTIQLFLILNYNCQIYNTVFINMFLNQHKENPKNHHNPQNTMTIQKNHNIQLINTVKQQRNDAQITNTRYNVQQDLNIPHTERHLLSMLPYQTHLNIQKKIEQSNKQNEQDDIKNMVRIKNNRHESLFYNHKSNQNFWYYNNSYCLQTCFIDESESLDCCCQTFGLPFFILGQFTFGNTSNFQIPCVSGLSQCMRCNCWFFKKNIENSYKNCLRQSVCWCDFSKCLSKMIMKLIDR